MRLLIRWLPVRKIERQILDAVTNRYSGTFGNTRVECLSWVPGPVVQLHTSIIYWETLENKHFSLRGYDTRITRSRLKLLGIPLVRKNGVTMIDMGDDIQYPIHSMYEYSLNVRTNFVEEALPGREIRFINTIDSADGGNWRERVWT